MIFIKSFPNKPSIVQKKEIDPVTDNAHQTIAMNDKGRNICKNNAVNAEG